MDHLLHTVLASTVRSTHWIVLAPHLVPYLIILLNCFLFSVARRVISAKSPRFCLLALSELVSTLELCVQCAELNIVYDLHGSWPYGLTLFLLSIWWSCVFGEAHATPVYVLEDLIVQSPAQQWSIYLRLTGQLMALPLAIRFAAIYWGKHLIERHRHYDHVYANGHCQSALQTSTLNGFLVEFTCCLLYRLLELCLAKWRLGQGALAKVIEAAIGSALVVAALELSGGYMNPALASSLEFGCNGADNYQHIAVFWLGPVCGQLCARLLHRRFSSSLTSGGSCKHVHSNSKLCQENDASNNNNKPASSKQQSATLKRQASTRQKQQQQRQQRRQQLQQQQQQPTDQRQQQATGAEAKKQR